MKTKEEIEQLAKEEIERYRISTSSIDKPKEIQRFNGFIKGYTQCQEDIVYKIIKLEEKLKLIEHIADEMTKDLIEQSEFFDGGFESVSKYYNYKQSLKKGD